VTLSAYALGMTLGQDFGFTSTMVLILLIGTLPGLGIFLLAERRSVQPMVDLSLFRNLLFSLSLLMAFLVFNVLSASFIMPFFLELAKGYSIEKVGLLMMVSPVTMGLIAPLAGALSDRFGSRGISLLGLVVIVVGAFSMSTIRADVTPLGFILRMAPFGLGQGLFQAPNNNAIMGSVPRHRLGIASGLLALSRTLGSASGLPLMGAIFASQVKISGNLLVASVTDATPQALAYGVSLTYLVAAFIIVAAALLAVLAFVVDARRRRSAVAIPAGPEPESSFTNPPPVSEI
jgi:MFS family permease